jgi:hypothetical protein
MKLIKTIIIYRLGLLDQDIAEQCANQARESILKKEGKFKGHDLRKATEQTLVQSNFWHPKVKCMLM